MKKIVIAIQIVVLILAVVKIASVFGVLQKADDWTSAAFGPVQALAQPAGVPVAEKPVKEVTIEGLSTTPPVVRDAMEDTLSKQRDLAGALAAQRAELDLRENAVRTEEQRLLALRKEIVEKIDLLKSLEEKIAVSLDAGREQEIKRYKDMAKVYEATPPAKAGPMMEKLDTKTAAGITINMKRENAGALWAFISPQKAVEITREITRAGGYKDN
jgi:flagellar motility protein MotE (MotC chaperone)